MTPAGAEDASTPLSPEEAADLIPNLATKAELNEWERENILQARVWANADRTEPIQMPSDEYIRKLHRKMFDQTWKWAGDYRRTEKNLGVPVHEIRERLAALCGDVRYWLANSTYSPDETAVRLHHRLVVIHLFPDGNGRHARLLADMLVIKLARPGFSWGAVSLITPGETRGRYLGALQAADRGEIRPLLEFART